jgi:hypothetical protein
MEDDERRQYKPPYIVHARPLVPGEAPEDRSAGKPSSFRENAIEHHTGNDGRDESNDHDDVNDGVDGDFPHLVSLRPGMRSDINGMGFFDLETSQKRSFQMLPLHPAPMPEG